MVYTFKERTVKITPNSKFYKTCKGYYGCIYRDMKTVMKTDGSYRIETLSPYNFKGLHMLRNLVPFFFLEDEDKIVYITNRENIKDESE